MSSKISYFNAFFVERSANLIRTIWCINIRSLLVLIQGRELKYFQLQTFYILNSTFKTTQHEGSIAVLCNTYGSSQKPLSTVTASIQSGSWQQRQSGGGGSQI
jgi:hypothetical protein